jgi:hypothetical protein
VPSGQTFELAGDYSGVVGAASVQLMRRGISEFSDVALQSVPAEGAEGRPAFETTALLDQTIYWIRVLNASGQELAKSGWVAVYGDIATDPIHPSQGVQATYSALLPKAGVRDAQLQQSLDGGYNWVQVASGTSDAAGNVSFAATLPRWQAAAIEQYIIVKRGTLYGGTFSNKINSISPSYSYYNFALEWAERYVRDNNVIIWQ